MQAQHFDSKRSKEFWIPVFASREVHTVCSWLLELGWDWKQQAVGRNRGQPKSKNSMPRMWPSDEHCLLHANRTLEGGRLIDYNHIRQLEKNQRETTSYYVVLKILWGHDKAAVPSPVYLTTGKKHVRLLVVINGPVGKNWCATNYPIVKQQLANWCKLS